LDKSITKFAYQHAIAYIYMFIMCYFTTFEVSSTNEQRINR